MALHGVTEAAKLAGKSRPTIYKDLKSGKLSSTPGTEGRPRIETGELERVYGTLQRVDESGAVKVDDTQGAALLVAQARLEAMESENRLLRELLRQAQGREKFMQRTIERLRLPLNPGKPEATPEPAAQPVRRDADYGSTFLERLSDLGVTGIGQAPERVESVELDDSTEVRKPAGPERRSLSEQLAAGAATLEGISLRIPGQKKNL